MEQIAGPGHRALSTSEPSPRRSELAAHRHYDADNLPIAVDHFADVALPGRLWAGWVEPGKPRELVRALEAHERSTLERRVAALAPALLPYARPAENDRIAAAIGELYDSYRMGQAIDGATAVARIAACQDMLAPHPAWAIEEACLEIRRRGYKVVERDGRVRVEQRFPPSDPQIFEIVEKAVAGRRSALASARALLAAPVRASAVRASKASVNEMLSDFHKSVAVSDVDAMQRAVASDSHRKAAAEANLRQRRGEYLSAGLKPPDGEDFTSLSLLLRMGWTIADYNGEKALVRPKPESKPVPRAPVVEDEIPF